MTLKLSRKQKRALDLLNDPQVTDLLFGGGAGGGKSVLVCIWMVLQCRDYPGIRIALGRKEMKRLKETTIVTLLTKVHKYLGVTKNEYVYHDQKGTISYINGSQIMLVDLKWEPSDPDVDTLGSSEFTHVVMEEVGEIKKEMRDVLGSRKNRYLNDEYGITGKTVMTCNPSQNFIRDEFYEPYKALGMGELQTWEHGDVYVPGEVEPRKAIKAFIRALVHDNPFASKNYIEELKRKPPKQRKRLYKGDWDYVEDDDILFTTTILDRAYIAELFPGRKVLGIDVSDKGKDETIATLIENGIIVWQRPIPTDQNSPVTIGDQTALGIIKIAQQNGINDKGVGFDVIGVGTAVRDALKRKGWFCHEYDAGDSSPEPGYYNLRSFSLWMLRSRFEDGDRRISSENPTNEHLRKQLQAHEYETEDNVVKVLSKKKVKQELGRSPDHADSAVIADWVYSGDCYLKKKKKSGRIIL